MANLTTLLYPVSAAVTNIPNPISAVVTGTVTANLGAQAYQSVNDGIASYVGDYGTFPISGPVTLEVNTNNCVLSSTGMPGVPSLSSRFTDSGIIMYINGASYNTETSYLQVRVGNNNFNNATLVMSRILPPNQNFEITIPYGIRGSPFHVIVCDSPVQPSLTDNQTFFSVNYKK